MIRPSPFQLLCGVGLFAIFRTALSKSPVLPLFAEHLGASAADIGLIAAASTVVGILVSLPAGALSDLAKEGSYGAALGTMSTIMDVGHASGPVAAGLLTGSFGYAVGFPAVGLGLALVGLRYPDDKENLAHQFEMYDALYAYCRLLVAREEAALR